MIIFPPGMGKESARPDFKPFIIKKKPPNFSTSPKIYLETLDMPLFTELAITMATIV